MNEPGEKVSWGEARRQLLVARLLAQPDVSTVNPKRRVRDAESSEQSVGRLSHLALGRHVDQCRRLVHDGDGNASGGLASAALFHTLERQQNVQTTTNCIL